MGYYTSYDAGNGLIFCDQTATVCNTFSDPSHRTLCKEIRLITCTGGDCPTAVINNGLIRCTEDTGWNCDLCGNDLPFNLPVDKDDTLYFQFQQIDNVNVWTAPTYGWDTGGCNVYLKDCCTGEYLEESPGVPKPIIDYCTEYFVGRYAEIVGNLGNLNDFQGIKIPLTDIYTDFKAQFPTSDCFYFEFEFFLSGSAEYLYTEPYQFVNCEDTIVLKSTYPKKDCDGYYYGDYFTKFGVANLLGTFFYYSNEIRLPAYLEKRSFNIQKEFVGNFNRTTNSQMTENWRLSTRRIPEEVATYIAKVLSGEKIYIGNGEFIAQGNIGKNNDVGSQWFLDADITRINCSKSFSCN